MMTSFQDIYDDVVLKTTTLNHHFKSSSSGLTDTASKENSCDELKSSKLHSKKK